MRARCVELGREVAEQNRGATGGSARFCGQDIASQGHADCRAKLGDAHYEYVANLYLGYALGHYHAIRQASSKQQPNILFQPGPEIPFVILECPATTVFSLF